MSWIDDVIPETVATCDCEGEITLTEEDFIDQIDKPN